MKFFLTVFTYVILSCFLEIKAAPNPKPKAQILGGVGGYGVGIHSTGVSHGVYNSYGHGHVTKYYSPAYIYGLNPLGYGLGGLGYGLGGLGHGIGGYGYGPGGFGNGIGGLGYGIGGLGYGIGGLGYGIGGLGYGIGGLGYGGNRLGRLGLGGYGIIY